MDLNERGKNILVASVLFLIFGAFLIFVFNSTLKEINNAYIKQNISIIGTLSKSKSFDEDKIIAAITKGNYDDYSIGKDILEKYSYKEGLDLSLNPIMNNIEKNLYRNIIIVWITLSLILLFLIYLRDKKNLMLSTELINRANRIIEGDFSENNNYKLKDGTFETLYESFSLMEDRIKRDISELKKEKINLKNIINDISHQLKTPLTALISYNYILKDYKNMNNYDIESFIELSAGQLERMDWLTITLLKYARLEGDVVDYKMEDISILDTISEAIAPLKIKAEEKNQNISINYENGSFILRHDRKWISEALSNIIKNGIEHTGNGGKIEILIRESPIYLEVEIKDNGEGIEEDKLKKIFERFYKNSSEKKPKSIGIGLALSKSIIEKHNGSIKVKSKLGEGTSFIIAFIK
ncbi:sensor histidine kinase [Clostridium thermobutyricum]